MYPKNILVVCWKLYWNISEFVERYFPYLSFFKFTTANCTLTGQNFFSMLNDHLSIIRGITDDL